MSFKGIFRATPALVFALGALFAPTIASAAAPDVDVLAFQSGRAAASVCWVTTMCSTANTYTFDTAGGTCLGVSVDSATDREVAAPCRVQSSGTFKNIVCGTGTVTGDSGATDTVITENDPSGDQYQAPGYTIVFAAGVGVVVAPTVNDTSDGTSGVGAGVVVISPADSNPGFGPIFHSAPGQTNTCTDGFKVASVLATNA